MASVTKTQLALISEGVRPGLYLYGSGGGRIVANPRTIRSLVKQGLAFVPSNGFGDWRDKAYLTRAGFAIVGATPPTRHPFMVGEEWP
jgi:hypothetical protein